MTIYLYTKQCSHCGLKYFGKHTGHDPHSYVGSGTRWLKHVSKHGKDKINTLSVWEFEDPEECMLAAKWFSRVNDIVSSRHWANQIEENGLDGIPSGIDGQRVAAKTALTRRQDGSFITGARKGVETKRANGTLDRAIAKGVETAKRNGSYRTRTKKMIETMRKNGTFAETGKKVKEARIRNGTYKSGGIKTATTLRENGFYEKLSRTKWMHKPENPPEKIRARPDQIGELLEKGFVLGMGSY